MHAQPEAASGAKESKQVAPLGQQGLVARQGSGLEPKVMRAHRHTSRSLSRRACLVSASIHQPHRSTHATARRATHTVILDALALSRHATSQNRQRQSNRKNLHLLTIAVDSEAVDQQRLDNNSTLKAVDTAMVDQQNSHRTTTNSNKNSNNEKNATKQEEQQ